MHIIHNPAEKTGEPEPTRGGAIVLIVAIVLLTALMGGLTYVATGLP